MWPPLMATVLVAPLQPKRGEDQSVSATQMAHGIPYHPVAGGITGMTRTGRRWVRARRRTPGSVCDGRWLPIGWRSFSGNTESGLGPRTSCVPHSSPRRSRSARVIGGCGTDAGHADATTTKCRARNGATRICRRHSCALLVKSRGAVLCTLGWLRLLSMRPHADAITKACIGRGGTNFRLLRAPQGNSPATRIASGSSIT